MEASMEDLHHFISYLWGGAEDVPRHIPRLSLDIWLDILLAIRNAVGSDDPETHRFSSIKSHLRNPYPDNVFSWMLNQLVELEFLTKQKDKRPYSKSRGVRYFLTENGVALLAMFDRIASQKIEGVEASF
jgi:DNA-binding HxlR family transcriptional regulator